MKKLFYIFLVLILTATGLFLIKGGHNAIVMANILEEWLDTDNADQTVFIQFQQPTFSVDATGKVDPQVNQWTITAETFWTEYHGGQIYGISAAGCTAYLRENILYMDSGRSYVLPGSAEYSGSLRELALGLLIHGRVTREGNSYTLSMNRPELELQLSVTAEPDLKSISLKAVTAENAVIQATLTPIETEPHPLPQPVLDAMVLAEMEMPMAITDPLEILLPALENLLPLKGELKLGVECGILELSESMVLTMDSEGAQLERKGNVVNLDLPEGLSDAEPAALALLCLRNGSFSREGTSAQIAIDLPPEATDSLCASLVPQLRELGMEFQGSQAVLSFREDRLNTVTMTAEGEVPFLITTIPLSFRAELTIP